MLLTLAAMATTYDVLTRLMAGLDVPDLEELFPRPAWMHRGACTDPQVAANFFPTRGESPAPAKAVCAECPVREDCLEYAVTHRELNGVWGGVSERRRRAIRSERLKSRAA